MLILHINYKIALPGDCFKCRIKLDLPIPMKEGNGFVIREKGKTLGCGKILKVISEDNEERRSRRSTADRRGRRDKSH